MAEAVQTLDGWYYLHDFRAVDWTTWKMITNEEREEIIKEFLALVENWEGTEAEGKGSHATYTIVGQKADFLFMLLRPTMEELNELETEFNKTRLADFLIPMHSYVSVVELGSYMPPTDGSDPYDSPEIRKRLYPILPKWNNVCFYPMNKRREGNDNWYMLPMNDRRKLMYEHGMVGRKYAGKIIQIISGSVGFDDYEWGVTLFANNVLEFKKIVYEMRFDEVSARYGEFGAFFVGNILPKERIEQFLHI